VKVTVTSPANVGFDMVELVSPIEDGISGFATSVPETLIGAFQGVAMKLKQKGAFKCQGLSRLRRDREKDRRISASRRDLQPG
jgi:hypothetical protein